MTNTRTKNTRTGHCINGQHEGLKPKSPGGKPMPTCMAWDWCKCKCHSDITAIYKLADLPREPPEQNPNFKPDKANFVMPDVFARVPATGLSSSGGTNSRLDIEGTVATPSSNGYGLVSGPHGTVGESFTEGRVTPVFAATPTGRRARGKLEYEVLEVCADFSRDIFDWEDCTPKNVSEEIGKRLTAECPSTGAIVEVFKRWEKLGFAKWDKKPIRLVAFEMDSSVPTLLMLKARTKRTLKRSKSDMKRGIRPPQPR